MKFYFSRKITILGVIAALLMLRASYWQWERYHWKLDLIKKLEENLNKEPTPIEEAMIRYLADPTSYIHRRVEVAGTYDFSTEVVVRNRRYQDEPGVFVITPLLLNGTDRYVLVNRGFVPLAKSKRTDRGLYHRPTETSFTGLIKEAAEPKFLAPADPPVGPGQEWVDSWLRVDVQKMSKQLPYKVAPFYLEIMDRPAEDGAADQKFKGVEEQILDTRAGREEMFFLPGKAQVTATTQFKDEDLPIPVFDTVIPPGRHYGYIFEWAIMAGATLLISFGLQLRKPRR